MTSQNIGVFVLLTCEDEVLLIKRSYNGRLWWLPGGAVEEGEPVLEALQREVREEIGLTLPAVRFLGVFYSKDLYSLALCYTGVVPSKGNLRLDSAEIEQAGFYPLTQLPEPLSPRSCVWIDFLSRNRASSFEKFVEYA